MSEPRISDYALIGDTRTAALCSYAGSIDWMCAPGFDGEPIFGKLIGGTTSGSFMVGVENGRAISRSYENDSAVLETRLEAPGGAGRLVEAMTIDVTGRLLPPTVLIRKLICDRGELSARVLFDPKLGLPGREPHATGHPRGVICQWGPLAVAVQTFPDIGLTPGNETATPLAAGSELIVVMTIADRSPAIFVTRDQTQILLDETLRWWEEWSGETTYEGPFRSAIVRSLITLQLLTFSPSGAPVAAPTTSLPEELGGSRNWDYRFSWPRDASIGLAAFLALGKPELAHSFMHWLHHGSRLTRPRLDVLYTLFGKPTPNEREVPEVPGYRGSLPVRIGNDARDQHQLDVYGWVVDAAWLLTQSGRTLHAETWRAIKSMADFVSAEWPEPDAGIWEVRGEPRHYVHSKLMAWLCLDRALKIADVRGVPSRRTENWREQRDRIKVEVSDRGFDDSAGSYVQAYDTDELDAAVLILPVLGFDDHPERVRGTIDAIRRELGTDDGLVFRYRRGSDRLDGSEGAFLPCSFWLIQALALTDRREEASQLFGKLVDKANDVGLFSEEIDPSTGELLGNFPQAFTHATLIQAALSLAGEDD